MKSFYFLFLFNILSFLSFSQTGKISGKVISASSGVPLGGASIILLESNGLKIADLGGLFTYSKLKAGTYSIKCSYAGYQEKIIIEIVVKENENTDVTISLDTKLSDNVVVTSKRVKAAGETVASLLIAQKNSANVSDGITAESIKRTPDKSSSDVIKRVSGASIQDDRFAVIRGLNDRYNAAFINGAPLPSTESDRKAFAFDIFPSAILENLIIYKTATPDKTGEFAGGIIEITTKSTSSKKIGVFSLSQGYNSLITGKNRYFSEMEGKNDWLGLDDGSRALPVGLPDKNGLNNSVGKERLDIAKRFGKYKWGIEKANTRPNVNFQLAKSFNVDRKQKEFISSIFSITYNRSFVFSSGERNSFEGRPGVDEPTPPVQRAKYIDSIYNDEIIWAALGNIGIKINNRNNISWKNNFSVNTDNRLVKRIGNSDFTDDSANIIKETYRSFISDKIYTSQLIGEHQIGKIKTKVNWLGAYSNVTREIPNQLISNNAGLPVGSTLGTGNGSLLSTYSQENIKNIKLDITQPYTLLKNSQNLIKIGAGYQVRERDFTSRILSLVKYDGSSFGGIYQYEESLNNLPPDQLFLGQYLGLLANGKAGLSIYDGTVPNSEYVASSTTTHAYIMNDQRYKKLRLIAGVRVESFSQKLLAAQRGLGAVNIDYNKIDYLPSANFVYALTPKTNLRLSYSKTVNRPEFRELASFGFFEYVSGLFVFGNDKITRAKIDNYDFRYELYPGKAQLLSVSAFYKKFTDPIEFSTLPVNITEATYKNSSAATVYGVEAEFRLLLSTLLLVGNDNSLLNKFTLSGNGAYIKSEVVIGKNTDSSNITRPLQGQSPSIINVALGYNDEKTGLSSTLSLNKVGDRLAIAGSRDRADYYDKGRTVIDFQIAKTFLENKIEVKFNIRDLLAQNIKVYLDFDKTRSLTEKDKTFSSNIAPKVFIFSTSFKF